MDVVSSDDLELLQSLIDALESKREGDVDIVNVDAGI